MDKTRYDIVDEKSGIFTVEVRKPGRPVHLVDGFDTREEAEAWVKAHRDPGPDPAGGLN